MNILLTGASSFTGYWFAKELSKAGHQVIAPLRGSLNSYNDGPRGFRVKNLGSYAEMYDNCIFGEEKFIQILESADIDVLCHHSAQVTDYRSPDFNISAALGQNTNNLRKVVKILKDKGAKGLLLTGSVFEQDEGAGEMPLRAFSPYGLSKSFTASITEYYCREVGLGYSKFVIPNPFGPFEEPRFCAYLMRTWKDGAVAKVNTPDYIRDNIHVSLLASAYVRYVENIGTGQFPGKFSPSGYIESQGAFATRFAREMRLRTSLQCHLELGVQTDFSEPMIRINIQPANQYVPTWNESQAWDEVASSYI